MTKAEAIAAAGKILARARAERDALPVREAAIAAHRPGGPSVDELEDLIRTQRVRAMTGTVSPAA
ncbi:hypothetical protein Pth03_03250 [Planotetraspora thailandica]|uniref:Uncharacterized protein n=1 Tax=Planotetraspora thailandica TaxID=487172 RepID=A0A8J3XTT5_9ACTN|nr:hypothetical protein [Planotetraspora thailandica]GII51936.1 hypothetical protein Pth03_03250 [Planotetraspora thailandica]